MPSLFSTQNRFIPESLGITTNLRSIQTLQPHIINKFALIQILNNAHIYTFEHIHNLHPLILQSTMKPRTQGIRTRSPPSFQLSKASCNSQGTNHKLVSYKLESKMTDTPTLKPPSSIKLYPLSKSEILDILGKEEMLGC